MASLLAFLYHKELVKRSVRIGKGKPKKEFVESSNKEFSDSSSDEEENFCVTATKTDSLFEDNIAYFQKDKSKGSQKIVQNLQSIQESLSDLVPQIVFLDNESKKFDLSEDEQGNGFRSTAKLAKAAVERTIKILQRSSWERSFLRFKKDLFLKNLEAWRRSLFGISFFMDYFKNCLILQCEDGNLLPDNNFTPLEFITLINTMVEYGSPLFGRYFAFQYEESLRKVLIAFNCGLCAFSEAYYSEGGHVERIRKLMLSGPQYINSPEKRERRMIKILQNCSLDFIKSFWSLNEMKVGAQAEVILKGKLRMEQHLVVPAQDMKIKTQNGIFVVPAPSSHVPVKPVSCYLISSTFREGMMVRVPKDTQYLPPSDTIIFHCHGGGFVSQSTQVHLVFLRYWARKLNVPVFSVDYSLAPEAKYPRQIEEVFSAYVWFLNNLKSLGTKGLKIIATGDSAGGVLISALTIKCIENNIRPPDGLFFMYTPFNLNLVPSPARMLSTYDPIIPSAYIFRFAKGYHDSAAAKTGQKSLNEDVIILNNIERKASSSSNDSQEDSVDENSSDTSTTASLVSKESSASEGKSKTRKIVDRYLEKFFIDYGEKKSIPIFRPMEESKDPKFEPRFSKAESKIDCSESDETFEPVINIEDNKVDKQRKMLLTNIPLGSCSLDDVECNLVEQCRSMAFDNNNVDYYYSPYAAPSDVLSKFPPCHFITCDYDFALDDSVMMAKKLRSNGVSVRLKCLNNLPHGYLNLCLTSEEAFNASKITLNFLEDLVEAI